MARGPEQSKLLKLRLFLEQQLSDVVGTQEDTAPDAAQTADAIRTPDASGGGRIALGPAAARAPFTPTTLHTRHVLNFRAAQAAAVPLLSVPRHVRRAAMLWLRCINSVRTRHGGALEHSARLATGDGVSFLLVRRG